MTVDRGAAQLAESRRTDLRDFTGYLLRRACVRVVGAERACLPNDSHAGELTLLSVLAERGAVSQRELSDVAHVNPTVVVRLVDALEARGWVVRERNHDDRRSYALLLTRAGHAALDELSRDLEKAEAELTQALTRQENKRLKSLLRQLLSDDPVLAVESLADRIGFLIAQAHRTFRILAERRLEPLGIHPRHFGVLSIVGREQPCSQREVASRIGLSAPGVLSFINELVDAGLVERPRNPVDRRSYDLALTTKGRRCLSAAVEAATEVQAEAVRRLGRAGDVELRALLSKLIH